MVANQTMKTSLPERTYGHISGVPVGFIFKTRGHMAALGVHRLIMSGIDYK